MRFAFAQIRKSRAVVLLATASLLCAGASAGRLRNAAAARTAVADRSARLQQVEAMVVELPAQPGEVPQRLSLAELMKAYNVPGLSIAVVENYKIVDAKAYGVTSAGSSTPVITETLFQAGSISKPVAAAAALALVEKGKLSLDEDVNNTLRTWKLPENEFTKTEKVTLRRLMSHTGGLTVHGFPGYDVDEPVPTLVQVFNGEKPANTPAIRVDTVPGTKWRYSGGGVTIEQQMMTDVTGKAFPALMRETVLDKVGMRNSSYEQPLPAERAKMTAGGTHGDGKSVHGKWHVYPEMAAAGLWTTPSDLARFAIEIALSKQGKSNRILSQKMTQEMLTPVMNDVGLGFFMEKDNPGQFGHDGADEGFQALLTMNADTGNGVAIMANSDNGITVANMVLRRVAKEYAWNYKVPQDDGGDELLLIAKLRGTRAALQRYDELKKTTNIEPKAAEGMMNGLGYRLLYSGNESGAIEVFQRNVRDYPQSANTYDSLGEAYMNTGQKDLAIQNYETTLQMKADNPNAVERLKKLKGDGQQATDPKIVEQAGFSVVGIAVRTSNAKEMTAEGMIGKQWRLFIQEGILNKIPNKADASIVAVYTDYASDKDGEYTFLLGARVTSDADAPAGMVAKKVPGGKFAMFTSEKGAAQKVVPETWMRINSLPKSAMGGDRVYRADFEIYDERARDPQNLQTDVYVGIK
jgi:CubicO group peptidase (beta-lactamase class C family)/predicted transcriptional regulator YdeE